jgi:hypothetical protein
MRGIGSIVKAVVIQVAVMTGFSMVDEAAREYVRQKMKDRADSKKRVSGK